jgi:hypothetical protein
MPCEFRKYFDASAWSLTLELHVITVLLISLVISDGSCSVAHTIDTSPTAKIALILITVN